MTSFAIPAAADTLIVSMNYAPDGVTWAMLFDNEAIGWVVYDTAEEPPAPIILGSLPPAIADAGSPQWGKLIGNYLLVPDHSRQVFYNFLTWLATNNGLTRKLNGENLFSPEAQNAFANWAAQHPDLTFQGEPPASLAAAAEEAEPEAEPEHEHHRRRGRHHD